MKPAGDNPDRFNILIVDDMPDNLRVLFEILTTQGYKVRPVSSGAMALKAIEAMLPDLILLDIKMPDMDGFELCRLLKTDEQTLNIPIIFISSYTETAEKIKAFDAGGLDYIAKPFHSEEILARIRTHLSIQTMQHKLNQMNHDLENRIQQRTADLEKANSKLISEIKERTLAEAALSRSEKRFRTLVANIPGANYRCKFDEYWTMEYISEEIENISGYPATDFLNNSVRSFASIIHPEDKLIVEPIALEAIAKKEIYIYEYRIVASDGGFRWVHERGQGIFDKDGNIAHLDGVILDITERKEAEQIIIGQQRRLELALDAANAGTWHWDMRSNNVIWDERCEKVFGLEPDTFAGTFDAWKALVHPDDIFESAEVAQREIESGYIDLEYRVSTKQGIRFVNAQGKVTTDKNNTPAYAIGIARDITEWKQLQQQLQQSQKMEAIGSLSGGIAHDFNNILTIILGNAEYILDDATLGSEIQSCTNETIQAAQRAKELVAQILAFSRQSDRAKSLLKVSPLVKEVCKFMRSSLPKTIELQQNIQASSDIILANSTQIHQVLMNLCTNAGYAMKKNGGVLRVMLEEMLVDSGDAILNTELGSGAFLKLTVRDTGKGIQKDDLSRIFDPYFTTKKKGEGTGLGLAVVHGIVHSHGGKITVDSIPGQGTTFEVFLPLHKKTASLDTDQPEPEISSGTETILFVDDEELLVKTSVRILKKLGYRVIAETNPLEALAVFEKEKSTIDLVITDKTMPGMTAFELSRKILDINPEMPIIVCTGFKEETDNAKIEELGIKDFVTKPISLVGIAKTIRHVLDNKSNTLNQL